MQVTCRWLNLLVLLISGIIFSPPVAAQVSNYIFTQSNGTYLPEAPAGTPATDFSATWDDNSRVYPVPFNFTYNGVVYSTSGTIGVDTDAWLAFSTGTITMTGNLGGGSWVNIGPNTGMYLYGTANNNGFAGLNCDLNYQQFTTINATRTNGSPVLTGVSSFANIQVGTRLSGTGIPDGTVVSSFGGGNITMSANATSTGSGTITPSSSIYAFVRGTAPNRQFVVQWTQAKRYSGAVNDNFNLQMILNEGGGNPMLQTLQVVYGSMSTTATANIETQVGLRGNTSADFNARKSSNGWLTTVAATTNKDSVRLNPSYLPSSGLTFTWGPCTAAAGNAGTITGSVNVCELTTVNYSLAAVAGAVNYTWTYTGSNVTYTAVTNSPSNSFTFQNGATPGQITVTPSNACGSGTSSSVNITVNPAPVATINYPQATYCSGAGSVNVNQTGVSGGSYSVSPAGITVNASSGQVNIPVGAAGTFIVTYTFSSGICGNTAMATINVKSGPSVATSATPPIVCNGGSSQLAATVSSDYGVSSVAHSSLVPQSSSTVIWSTYTDDQNSSAINIPFTFSFYGQSISQLYVNSNGYIMLQNSTASSSVQQTLPSATSPNNLIALAWEDLVVDPSTNSGAQVRYFINGTSPNRVFVIDYVKLTFYDFPNAGEVTGQIRLYENDNHIEIDATVVNDAGALFSKTMGIENATGTAGIASPGRNNVLWNTSAEAWGFYPPGNNFTYLWSPATNLDNTTIFNPVASGVSASTTYTVNVKDNTTGCSTNASVTLTSSSPLSGTYTVGTAGNFTTITAAVNAYNTLCIGGPVTFLLTDANYSTSETFPVVIHSNAYASAVNTLTIKPAPGISPLITGSSTIALLKLNGADHVTIDGSNTVGGTTRNLSLRNTSTNSTTSTVIWLNSVSASNGATNNSVKNCIIRGNTPTTTFTAVISSGAVVGAVAETGNVNNCYQNNLINTAQTAIAVVGPSGNETGTVISMNTIGSTVASEKLSWSGIEIYQQSGCMVSGNNISGITSANSTTAAGINVEGTQSGSSISGNKISDIKNTSTLGYGANGIYLGSSSASANVVVNNNFIYDVAAFGYNARTYYENGYGIVVHSGGNYKVYFNTVLLNTNQSTGNGYPSAFHVTSGVTGTSAIDLRNNIFANTQTQSGEHYAIQSVASASVFSSINYNDYYVGSGNLGYIGSTNRANLTNIVTGFGGNANSLNVAPVFISATDLHMNPSLNPSLHNMGLALAGYATDIDGNSRNGTNPDIGADEWVKPNTGSWVGKTSIVWTDPTNWEDNVVPDQNTDISVTGGYTHLPTITTTQPVRDIVMTSPAVITITGGRLQLYGNVINSGAYFKAWNGTIETRRTGAAQTISGSWFQGKNLSTLINSNSTGTILNNSLNDTLRILHAVLFGGANSYINTNNNLTLVSGDTSTARLGKILNGNSIIGNITVERYIPLHTKAWQFLAVPSEGQTIKASWQEGSASPNSNPKPGYGTQISGDVSGATAHPTPGFDAQAVAGPGMKYYDVLNPTQWTGVTSTVLPVYNKKGYMLFVRGNRSATAYNSPPSATKLRTTGIVKSPANVPPSTSVTAGSFESIGNPYASAINFDSVNLSGGVQRNFYVWDPKLTNAAFSMYGYGAFQTFSSNYPAPGYTVAPGFGSYLNGNTNIESGQAFLVYAPFTNGTVNFTESAKAEGSNLVTRNAVLQQLRTNLLIESGTEPLLLDGVVSQFHSYYSNEVDMRDAFKPSNFGENIGLRREGHLLAIERRKMINVSDTVFFNISGLHNQQYTFEFNPENWQQNDLEAFLEDIFTGSKTPVSLNSITKISFVIDSDASAQPGRFRLVFRLPDPEAVRIVSLSARRTGNNSALVKWEVQNEREVYHYEVERSSDATNFYSIGNRRAANSGRVTTTYTFPDNHAPATLAYYRIKGMKNSGEFFYSEIVSISAEPLITFFHRKMNEFSDTEFGKIYLGE